MRHDVVILGGGAAGLAAARHLVAKGLDVALLEARDRLGGRIWTARAGGVVMELGAEFVHGNAPRTEALAREAGLALVEGLSAQRWRRGRSLTEVPELDGALFEAMRATRNISLHGPDQSFVQALSSAGVTDPARSLAQELVEGFHAANAERISAHAVARGGLCEATRTVTGGYDQLVHWLAHRLPRRAIHLEHVAHSVHWSRGAVEVRCAQTSQDAPTRVFRAQRAIVALPLAVLPSVSFQPELASFETKTRALQGLITGMARRLALRFREAFWARRLPHPGLLHLPGAPFPVVWPTAGSNANVLVAWAGGSAAISLQDVGLADLTDIAITLFVDAFGTNAGALRDNLLEAQCHDWSRDPFARGAYSYPAVGGSASARQLGAPLDDTVFFAGEATSMPPTNGTVEGALDSGLRAADEVIRSVIRPTAMQRHLT